ncbi:hypothetical protein V8C86DRAFT_2763946 [Haematococcus lacustris]
MTYSLHAERAVCALLVMWQLGVLTHFRRGRAVWPVALGRQMVVWHALYCLFEDLRPDFESNADMPARHAGREDEAAMA